MFLPPGILRILTKCPKHNRHTVTVVHINGVVQEWSNATPGIECSKYGKNSIKSALLSFFRVSAFFFSFLKYKAIYSENYE